MKFLEIRIILIVLLFEVNKIQGDHGHFPRKKSPSTTRTPPSTTRTAEPNPSSTEPNPSSIVMIDFETTTFSETFPTPTTLTTTTTTGTSSSTTTVRSTTTTILTSTSSSTSTTTVNTETPDESETNSFAETIQTTIRRLNQLSATDNNNAVEILEEFESELQSRAFEIAGNFEYTTFDISIFLQRYYNLNNITNFITPSISLPKHQLVSVTPDIISDNVSVVISEFMINTTTLSTFLPDISNEPTLRKSRYFILDGVPIISLTVYDDTNNFTKINSQVEFTADLSNSSSQTQGYVDTFYNNTISIESIEYVCGFLDLTTQQFSTEGCENVGQGDNVRCVCEHTTIFAILLSITYVEIPEPLQIYGYVIGSITTASLLITVVILVIVRKRIRNDRIVIQINLALSLFFVHLLALVNDSAKYNARSCEFVAVSLHYSLLASGFWMLLEGVTLLTKTSRRSLSFSGKPKKNLNLFRYICGYGIAAIIVAISAAVGFTNEENTYIETVDTNIMNETLYKNCILNSSNKPLFITTLIAPLSIIIIVNCIIIIKVAIFVFKLSKDAVNYQPSTQRMDKNKLNSLGSALKAASTLEPVLGITWVFGFLVALPNLEASLTFLSINITVNGLQGLFILLIYCVFGSEVRKAVIEYRKKYKTKTPNIMEGTPQLQRTNNIILSDALKQHRSSKTTSVNSSPVHFNNKT